VPTTVDILIRSYYRDARWLDRALRSIDTHVRGYRDVVVVVPRSSVARMNPPRLPGVRVVQCADHPDDYLGQQLTKLHADAYTDADVVLHVDSDQEFVSRCDLRQDLHRDGLLRMAFDSSDTRPRTDGWRRCPSEFFGRRIDLNVAAPLPLAVPRHVYAAVRHHCESAHGSRLERYAAAVGAHRFSEAALLRGHVLLHEPASVSWVDVSTTDFLTSCRTSWSRAGTVGPPLR
jgi:hypothetical protein